MTQDDLAARAGLERSYVSDIERCRRNPTISALESLGRALEIDAALLLKPPPED